MLAKEKPDIAAICPRHTDQRLEIVTAAAEAGAHIILEKPFAMDIRQADAIVEVEDPRAGGEDLIVLGGHCFDLMRAFARDTARTSRDERPTSVLLIQTTGTEINYQVDRYHFHRAQARS